MPATLLGGLLSKESGCEGFRHLSPCSLNQSIYCQVLKLNSTIGINSHNQNKRAVRTRAPTTATNMQIPRTSHLDIHTRTGPGSESHVTHADINQ